MVVNKIYKDLEINKEEREREEKKLGLKRKVVLQFENSKNSVLKDLNGAVEGTNNEYFYYVYWVTPKEILEVYNQRLKTKV